MSEFIKKLQAKPVHVRERIAVGTAAGVSGILAVVWMATSVTTTGILSPNLTANAYFAKMEHDAGAAVQNGGLSSNAPQSQDLVGAAAAALGGNTTKDTAHLEIVDVHNTQAAASTSTPEKTVIPF